MDLYKVNKQAVGNMVNMFVGLAELGLLLRVVLRFFNANPDATFVHWVYTNTGVLLEPVRNAFPSFGATNRGWVIDFVALFAMVAYAAGGYVLVGLAGRATRK